MKQQAVDNNTVANCPIRDKILVERVFFQKVKRAVGTQHGCFHKYRVPTVRFLLGSIFFLPIFNSYGIDF